MPAWIVDNDQFPAEFVVHVTFSVAEAEATPEARLSDIKSAVVNGDFSFVPTTNDQIAQAARAKAIAPAIKLL